jgi:hypothetical protein
LVAFGLSITPAVAEQPIPFPHNRHVSLGLACLDCHSHADQQAAAGIPSVRKCILCHAKLATGKPDVQKVRDDRLSGSFFGQPQAANEAEDLSCRWF